MAADMLPMRRVFQLQSVEIVLLDDISLIIEDDAGRIVISGSHGGASSAFFALRVPASLYVFNDAGMGKDAAGVAALKILNGVGLAAIAVAHDSARIGEAEDVLVHGMISSCNRTAHGLGLRSGQSIHDALALLIGV
jgi:hypothetical protein